MNRTVYWAVGNFKEQNFQNKNKNFCICILLGKELVSGVVTKTEEPCNEMSLLKDSATAEVCA